VWIKAGVAVVSGTRGLQSLACCPAGPSVLAPPKGAVLPKLVTRVSLGRGFFPLVAYLPCTGAPIRRPSFPFSLCSHCVRFVCDLSTLVLVSFGARVLHCPHSIYRFFCRFRRVGRFEGHGITVLGFPCPRRSCSGHSSCAQFLFAPL
jgi:hypothetical protein